MIASSTPAPATVERVLRELAEPMRAGNLVAPLQAAIESLPTASRGRKRLLYGALRDGLRAWLPGAHPLQRARLSEILNGYSEGDGLDGERTALAALVAARHGALGSPPAGEVTILLAGTSLFLGRPFGAVQTLKLAASPWGGDLRLVHRGDDADDASFFGGFRTGCLAATSHLQSLPLGESAVSVSILIGNYRLHGELPALHVSARGESIGLGAAVATLSAVLGLPVPRDTAFTGRVDVHGALHSVEGLDAKVSAAAEVGVRTLFLPASAGTAPAGASGRSRPLLRPFGRLAEVADAVFSRDEIASGLERLGTLTGAGPVLPVQRRVHDASPADRVLLSVVGKSDPVGTLKDRGGRPLGEQDGPVLTVCRELRPRRVVLLYTTAAGNPANDFSGAAGATKHFIEAEDTVCRADLEPLDEVTDPTDVETLVDVLARRVRRIVDTATDASFVYANVTSGTPQMQIAWHLLAVYGVLPPRSQLLQIREARYAASDGRPRLRPVTLPAPPGGRTARARPRSGPSLGVGGTLGENRRKPCRRPSSSPRSAKATCCTDISCAGASRTRATRTTQRRWQARLA